MQPGLNNLLRFLPQAGGAAAVQSKEGEVLAALSTIIDPDFGMNIVDCGFIKDLVGAAA